MNKLTINSDLEERLIDKNIYGHFSEHLWRLTQGQAHWAFCANAVT